MFFFSFASFLFFATLHGVSSPSYNIEFYNASFHNVEHVAHFKHGVGGLIVDGDGSLGTGSPNGTVVPATGQFRLNTNCTQHPSGRFTLCRNPVRRVNMAISKFTSPYYNDRFMNLWPLLITIDITDENMDLFWKKWNR